MIYECDRCAAALPAGAKVCPKCGAIFQGAVPMDARPASPGFTARPAALPSGSHPAAPVKKWERVERILAKLLAVVTLVQCALSCFLLYVIVFYRLPHDGDDSPSWTSQAEASAGFTLIFSLLPTLIVLCIWVVAAISGPQTPNVWRLRIAFASSFCFIVSWILLLANLLAVKDILAVPEWVKSPQSELMFTLFSLAGSLLGAFAVLSRRKN